MKIYDLNKPDFDNIDNEDKHKLDSVEGSVGKDALTIIRLRSILSILTPYCICITLSLFIGNYFIQKYNPIVVQGSSMLPTFHNGDLLTCDDEFSADDIDRYDVIIFRRDNKTYIKRVIGLPGEVILIFNEQVWINYQTITDDFGPTAYGGIAATPYKIGDNEYFCLGDNRGASKDSRELGAIAFDEIVCLENGILFSFNKDAEEANEDEAAQAGTTHMKRIFRKDYFYEDQEI